MGSRGQGVLNTFKELLFFFHSPHPGLQKMCRKKKQRTAAASASRVNKGKLERAERSLGAPPRIGLDRKASPTPHRGRGRNFGRGGVNGEGVCEVQFEVVKVSKGDQCVRCTLSLRGQRVIGSRCGFNSLGSYQNDV